MDDLSYRDFTFTMVINPTSDPVAYSTSMSPSIDGIKKEEWDLMRNEDKMAWIGQACTKWVVDGMAFSWS